MSAPRTNGQSAYDTAHLVTTTDDVDADIANAMYLYALKDLGLTEDFSKARATSENQRGGPKAVVGELERRGITLTDRSVLDLGAGLGGMSEELVLQGANTFAIEPGIAWGSLAQRRAGRHGVPYTLHQARGEELPLEDGSMDVVISLQVLEHVQDPRQVIAEVYRVLKPGGHFYLVCENYLAFTEGHYRVAWLPLLPKRIGALYLRARGRSPRFLYESVTYVTFPQVMLWSRKAGFVRCKDKYVLERVASTHGLVGAVMKFATKTTRGRAPVFVDRALRTFRSGVYELYVKPIPD
jgi:ubiquinone/menaquinone biosynthesis C-methylase UbiE